VYYASRDKALNNGVRGYHLAAFLRRKGKVIKVGINSMKTHPRFKRQYEDGTWGSHMHAEMNVLRFARPGDELDVVRYTKCEGLKMAKPCDHCMMHIKKSGIKKVRFTNWEGEWEHITL
jgi:deoxycytidylate deaminase